MTTEKLTFAAASFNTDFIDQKVADAVSFVKSLVPAGYTVELSSSCSKNGLSIYVNVYKGLDFVTAWREGVEPGEWLFQFRFSDHANGRGMFGFGANIACTSAKYWINMSLEFTSALNQDALDFVNFKLGRGRYEDRAVRTKMELSGVRKDRMYKYDVIEVTNEWVQKKTGREMVSFTFWGTKVKRFYVAN